MTRPARVVLGVTDPISLTLLEGQPAYLRDQGWEVIVVAGAPMPPVEGATGRVIPMVRQPSPRRDLASLFGWVRFLRGARPDVVMAGTPKAGLLGTVAARLLRVPNRIYLLRGLRLETASGPLRFALLWSERLAFLAATEVICVSRSLADRCVELRLGNPAKITVLGSGSSNGVDLHRFRPNSGPDESRVLRSDLGLGEARPVVGYVGRITPDKGLDTLAEAAALLAGERDFQILVVGDEEVPGYAAELSARLHRVGVHHSMRSAVQDTSPYYRAMDVLCLPSRREGFPNVALEAAASGLPVVTSNATGCRDAILDGRTGYLAATGDARSLAGALAKVLEDPEEARAMGERGRIRVEAEFDRSLVWSNLAAHLRDLLAAQGGPILRTTPREPGTEGGVVA